MQIKNHLTPLLAAMAAIAIVIPSTAQNTSPWPASGNVGIGTASPTSLLHVNGGDIKLTTAKIVGDVSHAHIQLTNAIGSKLGYGTGVNESFFLAAGPALIYTNNTERIRVAQTGHVGIGTSAPSYNLHLSTSGNTTQMIESTANGHATLQFRGNNKKWELAKVPSTQGDNFQLFYNDGATWSAAYFTATPAGNIAIGTSDPQGYRLAVNGDAIFTKIKVKTFGTWPDYVFEPTYSLRPLSEVEKYIKEHRHLPEVPSAEQVANEGLDLGDNQAVLLKKIEELTLYVIELKKELEGVKATVKKVEKQNGN
jgi:hypothetical protein